MKTLTLTLLFTLLSGCSSYNNLKYMSRQEVSEAIRFCQESGQRASVSTAQVWFGNGWVDTPVNVICYPR